MTYRPRMADLPPEQRARLLEVMRAQGVAPVHADAILDYAARTEDSWRVCCDSACDPCVLALGRAVDAWRRLSSLPPQPPAAGSR